MAFPTVGSVGQSRELTAVTTHDVVVPASIASGDLLLMFTTLDANGTPVLSGMPSGWVFLASKAGSSTSSLSEVWYKIAVGGEVDFTYTTDVSEQSVTRTLRVINWHGTTPPEAASDAAETFTPNPDPPNLDPAGWAAEDTLWIAHYGVNSPGFTATAYPASYDDNQFTDESTGAGGCGFAVASRGLNAAAEDPGTFTFASTNRWTSFTVAIRPAESVGSLLWTPQPLHALIGR